MNRVLVTGGARTIRDAVVRAALDHEVQRFVYVSSSMVFERATQYPTTEEHIWECPVPRSAYGFSKLTGEVYVRAAHDEHGLDYTSCRRTGRCRSSATARTRARSHTSTTSPTGSSRRWARRTRSTRTSTSARATS